MTHEPTMFQHLKAGHDTNGNPRRCFVILDNTGTVLDVIDEGYAGRPLWLRDLVELPNVTVSAGEYRSFLKMAAKVA